MTPEETAKINAVAKQIQDILVENKMAMRPSISIGFVEEPGTGDSDTKESGFIVPETPKIIVPGQDEPPLITPENNLMNKADFMQP
jgi:hypothetical protein